MLDFFGEWPELDEVPGMETMQVSSPAEGVETLASARDWTEMENVSEGENHDVSLFSRGCGDIFSRGRGDSSIWKSVNRYWRCLCSGDLCGRRSGLVAEKVTSRSVYSPCCHSDRLLNHRPWLPSTLARAGHDCWFLAGLLILGRIILWMMIQCGILDSNCLAYLAQRL